MFDGHMFSVNTAEPDGLTGAILAFEGIADSAVILHGPTGCRGHHCSLSESAFPRDVPMERLNFFEPFFFGQPRIPTTYLSGEDFVFGATEKLKEALKTVSARNPGAVAIINSPGTALIGEDLQRIADEADLGVPVVCLDMPPMSRLVSEGFQAAIHGMLAALPFRSARTRRPKTVVLVGLSIAHRHWAGSLQELRRLLSLCGIDVLCVPGAGSSIVEWSHIPEAAGYVSVHAEYGERTAHLLADRFGGTAVIPECGAPIGFSATEKWLVQIAEASGADAAPALAAVKAVRRRVACVLARVTAVTGGPKGLTYGIRADASTALPLVEFLTEYLGMLPVSLETPEAAGEGSVWVERLQETLARMDCASAWQRPWQEVRPDFLFAEGCQVVQAPLFGVPTDATIELMLPMSGEVDLTIKPLLGAEGAAHLLERIVNAVPGMV